MKRYYNYILIAFFSIVCLGIHGCESSDDGLSIINDELTTLKEVTFEGTPQATPNTVQLTQEMQDQPAVNISWNKVRFPIAEAPVDYTIQFDVPSDTIGETAWDNAFNISVGRNVLSKEILVKNLNTMVKDLGLETDVEGIVVYRVMAYVDRTVYSKAGGFSVTSYEETLSNDLIYVPGTYQGWDPATAATLGGTSVNGVFAGIISFNDPAALDFKFTTGPNWDENYGGDGNGNLVFDGNNAVVPTTGSYKITVNLNEMKWTAEPYSFGIIGTATPGGWDSDTDMTYNYKEGHWEYTGALIAGALKFRLNDDWTVNYGSQNNTDLIAYIDDPGAHSIESAGNYLITFKIDANDPSIAYYTVEAL